MPIEDTEVVRRALAAFAAFKGADGSDVEALLAWCTDDVELRSAIIGGAEGNAYRGHEGLREWARNVVETFDELRLVADDVRQVGDVVLALGYIHARGGASGLELDAPSGWVVWVRDGRIAAMHGYLEHARAVEEATAAASPGG